jgi:O-antigen ligase
MKWVAFLIGVAAIVPLSGWLRRNPRESPKIWMLIGFLPFVVYHSHLYMAVISWAQWVGYVKGVELTVLDLIVLTVYLSLPRRRHALPFRLSMALYFFAVLLSVFQAEFPVAALFYPWQLARMFLLYATVATAVYEDPRVAPALMKGMAIALIIEAIIVIWQRFGLGMLQTPGTFIHQNMLGLLTHFVILPFFALFLAGRRGWLPSVVILSGIVVDILTVSRAAIGLAGFGFATVFILSAVQQWTPRKARVLMLGMAMMIILVPLVLVSLDQRVHNNNEVASDSERTAYSSAAAMMFADHPLGVGSNHFTLVANLGGYYTRAGVAELDSARYQNVHNFYWLVACETGYLGLVTLVLFLLHPLIVAFRGAWNHRGDQRGDWLIGLGVSLFTVYLHSFFEWIFIDYQSQYALAVQMGLVAGFAQQLQYRRLPRPQGAPLKLRTVPIELDRAGIRDNS